jgi:integrase
MTTDKNPGGRPEGVGNLSNALNDKQISNAKPGEADRKMTDGGGMYLLIKASGSKLWRMNYTFAGKPRTLALGVYPAVTLAAARARRDEARELLAKVPPVDPMAAKRALELEHATKHANTFKAVAREWLERTDNQRKAITTTKIERWMEHDVMPFLGHMPVADITAVHVAQVLDRINKRGVHDTVIRVKQIIDRVISDAMVRGLVQANPVLAIKNRDQFVQVKKTNHPAIIDPAKFAGLLRAIDGYTGHATATNALKLAPLLFVRPGELRQAEWVEIDLDKAVWTIPAGKMKMGIEHIVPLSTQAVAILRQQQDFSGHLSFVFPSIRGEGRPMSENTVNAALRALGYGSDVHVGHGFRASARTMLDEVLKVDPRYIEMQLSHAVKGPNGKAYDRTQFLADRRAMMQDWANFCDMIKGGVLV